MKEETYNEIVRRLVSAMREAFNERDFDMIFIILGNMEKLVTLHVEGKSLYCL